ncbi:MAG: LytTR family DNA-binding domain-containing protein [Acidobacteriota bacterium]
MNGTSGAATSVGFERYLVAAGAVVAVLFTVLDPSPSSGLTVPARLAFWLLHAYGSLAALALAQRWLDGWNPLRRRPWLALVVAGVAGSLLFAPLALGFESLFGLQEDFDGKGLEDLPRFGWLGAVLSEASEIAVPITISWIVIQLPWLLQLDFGSRSAQPRAGIELEPVAPVSEASVSEASVSDSSLAQASEAKRPASQEAEALEGKLAAGLFSLLPSALGRDIASLTSELHYLRVRTPRGKAMVLYNLKDAVAELESSTPGLRVHRSHWVAHGHVRRLVRSGSGWSCEMSTGDRVPVSRRRSREALAAFGEGARYTASS